MFRICPSNITKSQKTKDCKNCHIYNFFFFKCPIRLIDSSSIIFSEKLNVPLIKHFYTNLYIKVKVCCLNTKFLQKTEKCGKV